MGPLGCTLPAGGQLAIGDSVSDAAALVRCLCAQVHRPTPCSSQEGSARVFWQVIAGNDAECRVLALRGDLGFPRGRRCWIGGIGRRFLV